MFQSPSATGAEIASEGASREHASPVTNDDRHESESVSESDVKADTSRRPLSQESPQLQLESQYLQQQQRAHDSAIGLARHTSTDEKSEDATGEDAGSQYTTDRTSQTPAAGQRVGGGRALLSVTPLAKKTKKKVGEDVKRGGGLMKEVRTGATTTTTTTNPSETTTTSATVVAGRKGTKVSKKWPVSVCRWGGGGVN